jgi:outer membrane protein OmpA-like peptidoglycan-associated protein
MTGRSTTCHAVLAVAVAIAAAACSAPQAVPTSANTTFTVNVLHIAQIGHGLRAAFVHCQADRCPVATTKTLAPAPSRTPTPTPTAQAPSRPERLAQQTRTLTVHFALASARIDAKALQVLRDAAPLLRRSSEVSLSGHTDAAGSIAANVRLASARAEAVRTALRSIAPSAAAKASISMPEACCTGEAGRAVQERARSRRVDIRLVLDDDAG